MAAAALPMSWRISPGVDSMLNGFLPPDPQIYFAFLDFLMAKKETAAAGRVWAQLVELRQPLKIQPVFSFLHYLIGQQEVGQARTVWQQCASLCGLQAYQPSSDNLIVNADFTHNILNGGFDWVYRKSPEVSLVLDPTQPHLGHRSLLITFNARNVDDAGIQQLIPVEPETSYDFSGYFKVDQLEGAGGPRFAFLDANSKTLVYASNDLKDSDSWEQVGGTFATGPGTKLLALTVKRFPSGSPIKGKLWIADLRMTPTP
jgi:hypothetical protein